MTPLLLNLIAISTDSVHGFARHAPLPSSRMAHSLIFMGVILLAAGPLAIFYGRRRFDNSPRKRLLNASAISIFALVTICGAYFLNSGMTKLDEKDQQIKIRNVVHGSKEFEDLVGLIKSQLAKEKASISFSEPFWDPSSGREVIVPILMKGLAGAHPFRVAVELYDQPDKLSTNIIDYVSTKYHSLSIQHVVIVSKSGFMPAARKKAELNKLTPLSLPQAVQFNWATLLKQSEEPADPKKTSKSKK